MHMDIEKYYSAVQSGNRVDNREVIEYIKSFPNIVVWGASYLGRKMTEFLRSQAIHDFTWWDARADEIREVDGHSVITSFPDTEKAIKEKTLVILCIGNTAIINKLLLRLKENEYFNVLRGDKLFMGVACPFDVTTGIDGLICNGTMTCRSMFCSRLHNIIKERNNRGGLFLQNITIMITSHCSLKCKYCCAYMNSYPEERRKFVSYDQIASDIETIFTTVDAVGSVTIQGGEPFLHPDIDRIVAKLLEQKNFGIVSIATNGIFKISEEKLDNLRDNRLNVAFSGYYDALPREKLDIYYKNIELLKNNHIPVTVGVKVPEWSIPSTLWDRHYSEEIMTAKKAKCKMPERCLQVMEGKLFPCLYSVSLHGIGIADYPDDYVDLSEENLPEKIQKFMDRSFYRSCGHCKGSGGSTGMAGEQGFYDFVTEKEEE